MKIGIVTGEISLYPPFGGIATASEGLARSLRAAGLEVDLLFFPEERVAERRPDDEARIGLRFFDMRRADSFKRQKAASRSHAAYQYLANEAPYDLLLWPDYRGLGYYAMEATRSSAALTTTRHLVLSYGPLAWCQHGSGELDFSPARAEVDYLERASYALADMVVFNSDFLRAWCVQQRYEFADSRVIPSLVPAHFDEHGQLREASQFADVGKFQPIDEFAFFGRLESRKGFEIFVEAIRLLAQRRDLSATRVSFFGRSIFNRGLWAHIDIVDKLFDLPLQLHLIDDASTADFIEYCQTRGVLAVTPSIDDNLPGTMIECVNHGIPLLATDCGGCPEIIAAEHHHLLCAPRADLLSQRLDQALNEGHPTLKPAHIPTAIRESWIGLFDEIIQRPGRADQGTRVKSRFVDVTVGVVHYNRPRLLARALESIARQTVRPRRVVVVDDNSPRQAELESVLTEYRARFECLEVSFEAFINPTNRYLGACRNRILDGTDTTWVLFQDDDDVAMPEMLEKMCAAGEAQGADVVVPHLYYLPEEGDSVTPLDDVLSQRQPPTWFFRGADVNWGLFGNAFGPACSLFRTSVVQGVNGFTELAGVGYEDYELLFKLALRGHRFAVQVEALFAYRTNPNSMVRTTNLRENFARVFRMVRQEVVAAVNPPRLDMLSDYVFTHEHLHDATSVAEPKQELLRHRSLATKNEQVIAVRLRKLLEKSRPDIRFGKEGLVETSRSANSPRTPATTRRIRAMWVRFLAKRTRS
ncbi:MAG: glycosyltransferase [Planctomycetales bacterium]|nr:glycosyltransferase [Planctomycetales bacterium]